MRVTVDPWAVMLILVSLMGVFMQSSAAGSCDRFSPPPAPTPDPYPTWWPRPVWNVVTDCGAAGDGVTDDTGTVSNALDIVGYSGGTAYFPSTNSFFINGTECTYCDVGMRAFCWTNPLYPSTANITRYLLTGSLDISEDPRTQLQPLDKVATFIWAQPQTSLLQIDGSGGNCSIVFDQLEISVRAFQVIRPNIASTSFPAISVQLTCMNDLTITDWNMEYQNITGANQNTPLWVPTVQGSVQLLRSIFPVGSSGIELGGQNMSTCWNPVQMQQRQHSASSLSTILSSMYIDSVYISNPYLPMGTMPVSTGLAAVADSIHLRNVTIQNQDIAAGVVGSQILIEQSAFIDSSAMALQLSTGDIQIQQCLFINTERQSYLGGGYGIAVYGVLPPPMMAAETSTEKQFATPIGVFNDTVVLTVSNSSFSNVSTGLYAGSGSFTVTQSSFSSCSTAAVTSLTAVTGFTISSCSFESNHMDLDVSGPSFQLVNNLCDSQSQITSIINCSNQQCLEDNNSECNMWPPVEMDRTDIATT